MNIKNLYKEKSNTEFEKNIICKDNGDIEEISTELLIEHYTTLYVNDIEIARLVCTDTSIVELAVGKIINEGLLRDVDLIENIYVCQKASRVRVFLKEGVSFDKDWDKSIDLASCCQDNKSYFKTSLKPYFVK